MFGGGGATVHADGVKLLGGKHGHGTVGGGSAIGAGVTEKDVDADTFKAGL